MTKSKAKGTRAETAVCKFFMDNGIECERRALRGRDDVGDLKIRAVDCDMIVEVKAGKQTSNPNRTQMKEWMRQTITEGENANSPAILVIVRYNRPLVNAEVYVYESFLQEWRFMYLDELIEWLSY